MTEAQQQKPSAAPIKTEKLPPTFVGAMSAKVIKAIASAVAGELAPVLKDLVERMETLETQNVEIINALNDSTEALEELQSEESEPESKPVVEVRKLARTPRGRPQPTTASRQPTEQPTEQPEGRVRKFVRDQLKNI